MMHIRIEIACLAGHRQTIRLIDQSIEQARLLAGLLDGSSMAYMIPPGKESPIGKCGICGKPIVTKIEEEPAPPPEYP